MMGQERGENCVWGPGGVCRHRIDECVSTKASMEKRGRMWKWNANGPLDELAAAFGLSPLPL